MKKLAPFLTVLVIGWIGSVSVFAWNTLLGEYHYLRDTTTGTVTFDGAGNFIGKAWGPQWIPGGPQYGEWSGTYTVDVEGKVEIFGWDANWPCLKLEGWLSADESLLVLGVRNSTCENMAGLQPLRVMLKKTLPNRPPTANAGSDRVFQAGEVCYAKVTLDGTGSSDTDGDALNFVWNGSFGTAIGPTPTVTLPLGAHIISLNVDDGKGGTGLDTVNITVRDRTPPVMTSLSVRPFTLWPPNHNLVPVNVRLNVSDNCDPSPVCRITSVSSNEPENGLGHGDTAPDWQITGNLTVNLRAERSGNGKGRVYTLSVICTDAEGNGSVGTASVNVPHDQGSGKGKK